MIARSQQTTDHGPRATDPRPALAIVEPDDAAWDTFTQQHPQGHLLQSARWGALKARFGWERRRVAVAAPEGLLAGAQVLFRRRLGVSVAYVPRGPLFAGATDADALMLAALDQLARRGRAVFLRLEPNLLEHDTDANVLHSFLLLRGFQTADPIQPRSTIHLDLTPAPERLLAAMSKGHRADIRRAEREGVAMRVAETGADLDTFYAIMQATGARAGFAIHSRAYYQAAWDLFRADGHAQLLLAEHDGASLAAFLVFTWAGEGFYLYSGAIEAGMKSGANHALQRRALLWAREHCCARYDFWGIPDELGQAASAMDEAERVRLEQAARDDPLFGVFRFKKGFGGQIVRYLPAYDRIYLSPLYALWRRRIGS
jgi:serine/alanine adding enzyme